MNILEPYVLPSQIIRNAGRQKRQLLAFLGSTVLSFAMGAVSEYQMYKINKHVSSNSEAISALKSRLDAEQGEIIALKSGLIGISKEITSNLAIFLERTSCTQLLSDLSHNLEFAFHEYTHIVDELLFTIIDGHGHSLLSPRTVSPEAIRHLIHQHDELNKTVFYENPLLLYSTAKVHLASVDNNLEYAHFILEVPLLYVNNSSYKLFQTAQVGTFISEDTCVYYDMPKLMYDSHGTFFEIRDTDECTQRNALYICPTSSIFRIKACIQRNLVTCKYHRDRCDYHYSYKMSTVGVLIRDNLDHDSFVVNETGWTTLLHFPTSRTAYVPWTKVQALQIGDAILTSPNIPRNPITMVNLTANLSPFDFIDSREVSMVFGEICERYNTSLNELITPVISESHANIFTSLEFIWILFLTITMVGLLGWTTSLQIKIYRKETRPTGGLPSVPEVTTSTDKNPNSIKEMPINSGVHEPPEYSKSSLTY